ncbi:MAG TPA: SDR family oxidoreductase [Actinocrinis sp.]|nr:SDR family oxidoreductase [Actinocrinis sp.]
MTQDKRPVALVTGVGRRAGIGAAIVDRLAEDGWDVAFTYWRAYDDRMAWGRDEQARAAVTEAAEGRGARVLAVEADLARPDAPEQVFARATAGLGDVRALVMAHAESVDSAILDTTLESWERHFAVNARAVWLLIRQYALHHRAPHGAGRIVALTSDHTAGNLPYGASKGALDRIVLAGALELKGLGITANVVNPGPVQTGWMSEDDVAWARGRTPLGRNGTPADSANLIAFLCSEQGGWINGRLLHSDGGFAAAR